MPEENAAIPGSQGDDSQVTRGDDRDFSSTSKEYRVLQQVTLIPSKALDEDGVMDGSTVNLHGLTAVYELGSSVNPETGRLTQRARSESLIESNKGVPYMIDYGKLGAVSAVLPMPRPGSSTSDVHLDGLVFDPLVVGDCPLVWDLRVLVSVLSPSKPVARVEGTHGGFPAFDLYIDGQPVYQWKPPAGETAERLCKPGSVEQVDTGLIFLK